MANRNAEFLSVIDKESKDAILSSIAKHYGISVEEAFAEVSDEESHDLLEYMIEPLRSGAHFMMCQLGFK